MSYDYLRSCALNISRIQEMKPKDSQASHILPTETRTALTVGACTSSSRPMLRQRSQARNLDRQTEATPTYASEYVPEGRRMLEGHLWRWLDALQMIPNVICLSEETEVSAHLTAGRSERDVISVLEIPFSCVVDQCHCRPHRIASLKTTLIRRRN